MADALPDPTPAPPVLVEIQAGDGLTLAAAGRLFPGHRGGRSVDPSTVFRWLTKGTTVGGRTVKLEGVRAGSRWLTSRPAVARFANGHTPLRHDLEIGDVLFLTAEHVSDFRVDYGTEKRVLGTHHEGELSRTAVRNGDILVTIKGRVGNCAVVDGCPESVNINQDVALIRLGGGTNPYFFAAWFNSVMGKQLVEKHATGGINPFLGLGNLRKLPFPVVDSQVQNRIGGAIRKKVLQARDLYAEADSAIENGKRRVEELIENGQ